MPPPRADLPSAREGDLTACRAVLREGSKSFFAASLLLPQSVRAPASALYAFCRVADDAVDVAGGDGRAIARLEERVVRACAGRPLPDPIDRAFAATAARFAIPRSVPLALVEGLAWDVERRRYHDLADLEAYAARVAGTVGVMMSLVMGVREPAVLARAADLGVAMQLTNIARDIGEDARAGRLYLPLAWLEEAGIDPAAWMARPRLDAALDRVVARLLATADRLYRRAEPGIAGLPAASRPAIMAARLIYAEIGREIERQGLDSLTRRAVVAPGRKLGLLLRAAATAPTRQPLPATQPLAATRFLIDAVAATPPAELPSAAEPAGVAWVLDLFERLERRDRVARAEVRT